VLFQIEIATQRRLDFVLTLPIDRINLSRIGTAALEHLFGVTRLGTGGSDSAERIIRLLARAFVVKKIAEEHGIDLRGRTKMNLAGTVDDLTKDRLLSLPNLDLPGPIIRTVAAELFCSFIQNPWGPRLGLALHTCRAAFSQLSELIIDGQKEMPVSALAGFSVLPLMTTVAASQQREKVSHNDTRMIRLNLCSAQTQKMYHLLVYPGESIGHVRQLLETKYGLSVKDIYPNNSRSKVLDDDDLIGELDLASIYHFRERNQVDRENDRRFR
jgi:hypothetical protein